MSFLDDLSGLFSGSGNYFSNVASSLAKTAILGLAANQLSKSINADNSQNVEALTDTVDPQTKLQNNADTENKIPVVYGNAFLAGSITDAYLADDGLTMSFVSTICEKTGNINLGQGGPSVISFQEVYWNGNKIIFKNDGYTLDYIEDPSGNRDTGLSGLIKIWCFNGSSTSPTNVFGYTNPGQPAYSIMPGWDSTHTMNDLIFAVIQVKYSASASLTSLGTVTFHINNTMSAAGDCLYDYMTNTRYGAGIDPQEIYAQ